MKTTVRLRIVLHVEHDHDTPITLNHLAVALHRAEGVAARVLLCGDGGGELLMTDGPPKGGVAVLACASSITTGDGDATRTGAKP